MLEHYPILSFVCVLHDGASRTSPPTSIFFYLSAIASFETRDYRVVFVSQKTSPFLTDLSSSDIGEAYILNSPFSISRIIAAIAPSLQCTVIRSATFLSF